MPPPGYRRSDTSNPENTHENAHENIHEDMNTEPSEEANEGLTVAQFMEVIRQQAATIAQQQQNQQRQETQGATFKSFLSVKPPDFQGTSDPVKAQTWIKEIERAFVLAKIGEDCKTEYASYFLKDEAGYWWETAKALEGPGEVSWEKFKQLFLEKYYPRYVRHQMETKFFNLKQENMTVAEYERKFTEYSRFVTGYASTDEEKARRFLQGLKPWLRSRVEAFELTTYASMVQKAMIIEGPTEQTAKSTEPENKKRKFESQEGSQRAGNFQNRFNRPAQRQQN